MVDEVFHSTREIILTLSAGGLNILKLNIDASFAMHADFKSHTGSVMSMGKGEIIKVSQKQKLYKRAVPIQSLLERQCFDNDEMDKDIDK